MTFKERLVVASHYLLATVLSTIIWLCLGALMNTIDGQAMPGAPVGFFWTLLYAQVLVGSCWLFLTFKFAYNLLNNLFVFVAGLLLAFPVYAAVMYGVAAGAAVLFLCVIGTLALVMPAAMVIGFVYYVLAF